MPPPAAAPARPKTSIAFWLGALVTAGNLLVALAFAAVAILRPEKIEPDGAMGGAAHVFAFYVAARTIPLAIAVLVTAVVRSRPALRALAFVATGTSALDAFIGALGHHKRLTIGPAAVAIVTLVAAIVLLRPPKKD